MCVGQPNGWITSSLGALIRPHPPLQSGIMWTKGLDAAQASGREYFLPILQAVGQVGARSLSLVLQHTNTTGTLELYSTTPGCGSCSTGSTCWASEKEVGDQYQPPGRAVPISSPLGSSQIQSQCPLALVTLKGKWSSTLILTVGDLPLPLPTSLWRMIGGFTLHLKFLRISGVGVKSCEEFLFPFCSLRSG